MVEIYGILLQELMIYAFCDSEERGYQLGHPMAEDDGLEYNHGKHVLPIQSRVFYRFPSQSTDQHTLHIFRTFSSSINLWPCIRNDMNACIRLCIAQTEQGHKHSAEAPLGFVGASSSIAGGDDVLPRCMADNSHLLDDTSGKNGPSMARANLLIRHLLTRHKNYVFDWFGSRVAVSISFHGFLEHFMCRVIVYVFPCSSD